MSSIKSMLSKTLSVVLMFAGCGLILFTSIGVLSSISEGKFSSTDVIAVIVLAGPGVWLLVLSRRYGKHPPAAINESGMTISSASGVTSQEGSNISKPASPRPAISSAEIMAFKRSLDEQKEGTAKQQSVISPKKSAVKQNKSSGHATNAKHSPNKHT